ncbi:MAG: DUF4956 domain-containing protein, partial [Anaerolineales bacterium]
YINFGNALSNRKSFGGNFILITMTTMLIITVVKSSLALSLGLVGALSIVRFRTAIKEPEELTYAFLAIAIGLGLGADQRIITVIGFTIIVSVIWFMNRASNSNDEQNLYLTVSSSNSENKPLEDIVQVLRDHCTAVSLKRFDDTFDNLEALFLVEIEDFPKLEAARSALKKLDDSVMITFLETKGVGGT